MSKNEDKSHTIKYFCPECQNSDPDVVEDFSAGDVICRGCGLVLSERLVDEHSEWRTFHDSDNQGADPNRVGGASNPLLQDGGLSTSISKGDGSSSSASNLSRTHNKVSLGANEKSLTNSFKEIQRMAERINLPQSIIDRANELFKHMDDFKSTRGRNADGVIAASLYIACRLEDVPRTFKEICALTQISKKEISHCYKNMVKHLKDKKLVENLDTITTTDFMNRFCNQLELAGDVTKAATLVCNEAMRLGIMAGKSPISVAAAGIYMVSQLSATKRTQKAIADISGVSEVTIRNAYKDLYPRRTELLPPDSEFQKNIHNLPTS